MELSFYHYTSANSLRSMEDGSSYGGKTGLLPVRRFVPLIGNYGLPEKAHEGASFGLLHAFDTSWCQKTFQPQEPLLETIIRRIEVQSENEIYLLKVSLLPTDAAYVADYSAHLNPKYRGWKTRNQKIVREVKQAYWNSLVPFAEYIDGTVSYLVPEVVCFSPLPLERLRVVQIYDRDNLINQVRYIGGFPAHPPRKAPDYDLLRDFLGDKPKRLRSTKPNAKPSLHLIT